jgi:peptidoglycan hydrolase-like protein with peptidoglycan-binding domain
MPLKPETATPMPRTRPDPIGDLIAPTPRVIAVQRALNDFGYGPVKATGVYGPETIAAIQKLERDRKLPVTGQISPRVLKELSALTGKSIE